MARTRTTAPPRSGVSLAKGPVGIIGILSLALGVLGFIFSSSRSFTMHAPSGNVTGGTFVGIAGNGWTWVLFAAIGLFLLLGAPTHWGAKSAAFIAGLVAGAASIIAIVDGKDVFGIIAENGWTELVLGAGAVALLVLAMLPRVGRRRAVTEEEPVRPARPVGRRDRTADGDEGAREPVATGNGTTRRA